MRGGRAPSGGQYNNGGASRPLRVVNGESGSGQVGSIDLVRSTGAPAGLRRASALVTVAVSVAEHERGRDPELALEARAPLLPALLVLELVLVQRRRLLDAVSEPELDGQLASLLANLIPRRAERELIGDGADAARMDVARQRHGTEDWARPVRGLRVDRHGQDVEVVAAPAVAGHHRARRPWRCDLARRRPVPLGEGEEHRIGLTPVGEALLPLDVVQPLGRHHVAELIGFALLVTRPDTGDDEAGRPRQTFDVVEVLGRAKA